MVRADEEIERDPDVRHWYETTTRNVRNSVANGGKPDIVPTAHSVVATWRRRPIVILGGGAVSALICSPPRWEESTDACTA
jgi:hypothetical protein